MASGGGVYMGAGASAAAAAPSGSAIDEEEHSEEEHSEKEKFTPAQLRRKFRDEYYNVAPQIEDIEKLCKIADTIHDYNRGFRNKPKGDSADYVNKFIDSYIDKSGLPQDMKNFLKAKKSDIEDSTIEYFEVKANLPWIGPIDMNARETYDELFSNIKALLAAKKHLGTLVNAAEEYGKVKRRSFDSYELKPGTKAIRTMSDEEKEVVLAFINTFFYGGKDVRSVHNFDGPTGEIAKLAKKSKIWRGFKMPQTITDSAPTSFKPLTSLDDLYYVPSNRAGGGFVTDSNIFTAGKYIISYWPVAGKTFTEKSRFAWTYNIDLLNPADGSIIKHVEIPYGTIRGVYPTEGPSVDQLLELQIKLSKGEAFDVRVDKITQLDITKHIVEPIISDMRNDIQNNFVSLLFDIKREGDYGQAYGIDESTDEIWYGCNWTKDRLQSLASRLNGKETGYHNGDNIKLYKTRLRERALDDKQKVVFETQKLSGELKYKKNILIYFCNRTILTDFRGIISGMCARMKSASSSNPFLLAKITDIENYVEPISHYTIEHSECSTISTDPSDLPTLRTFNNLATQMLTNVIRNLNIYKFTTSIIDASITTGRASDIMSTIIPAFYKANIRAIFTDITMTGGVTAATNMTEGVKEYVDSLYKKIYSMLTSVTDESFIPNNDTILNTIADNVEKRAMTNADTSIAIARSESIPDIYSYKYGVVALVDSSISIYVEIISSALLSIGTPISKEEIDEKLYTYISNTLVQILEANIPTSQVPYSGDFLQNLIKLVDTARTSFNENIIHNELNYSPVRANELQSVLDNIRKIIISFRGSDESRYPPVDFIAEIDKYNSLLRDFCRTFYNQGIARDFFISNCIKYAGSAEYSSQFEDDEENEGDEEGLNQAVFNVANRPAIKKAYIDSVNARRNAALKKAYYDLIKPIVNVVDSILFPSAGAASGGGSGGAGAASGGGGGGAGAASRRNQGGGSRQNIDLYIQHGGNYNDEDDDKTFPEVVEDFLYEVSSIVNESLSTVDPRLTTYARLSQLLKLDKGLDNINFVLNEFRELGIAQPGVLSVDTINAAIEAKISADFSTDYVNIFLAQIDVTANENLGPLIESIYKEKIAKFYSNKLSIHEESLVEYIRHPLEEKINGFMLGSDSVLSDDILRSVTFSVIDNPDRRAETPRIGFLTNMTFRKAAALTMLYDMITYNRAKVSYFSLFFPVFNTIGEYKTKSARTNLMLLFDGSLGPTFLSTLVQIPFVSINAALPEGYLSTIIHGGARNTRRRHTRRRYSRRRYSRKQQRRRRMTRKKKDVE